MRTDDERETKYKHEWNIKVSEVECEEKEKNSYNGWNV